MTTSSSYAQMNSITEETTEDDASSIMDSDHGSISSPLGNREEAEETHCDASRTESMFSLVYSYSSDLDKENKVDVEWHNRVRREHSSVRSSQTTDSSSTDTVASTVSPPGLRQRRSTAASPFSSSSKNIALKTSVPGTLTDGLDVGEPQNSLPQTILKTPDRNVTYSYRKALLSPDLAAANAEKTPLIRNRGNGGGNNEGKACALPTWKSTSSILTNSLPNSEQPTFLSPQPTRNNGGTTRKMESNNTPGRNMPAAGTPPATWSLTSPFLNWLPGGPFSRDKHPKSSISEGASDNEQQQCSRGVGKHMFTTSANDASITQASSTSAAATCGSNVSSMTSTYRAPTELHQLCHDAQTIDELMDYASLNFPSLRRSHNSNGNSTSSASTTSIGKGPTNASGSTKMRQAARRQNVSSSSVLSFVTATDIMQRLPLHVLSENNRLIRSNFDCDPDDFVYCDDCYCNQQAHISLSQKTNSLRMQHTPPFSSPAGGRIPTPHSRRNDSLLATRNVPEEEHDVKSFALDFVKQLVQLHPAALVTMDNEGYFPFMRTIARWIDFTHALEYNVRSSRWKGFIGVGGGNNGQQGDDLTQEGASKLSFYGLTTSISKTLSIGKPINKSASVTSVGATSPYSTYCWNNNVPVSYSSSSASLERAFDNCVATYSHGGIDKPQSTGSSCEEKGISTAGESSPPKLQSRGLPVKTPGRSDSESSGLSLGDSGKSSDSRDKQFPKVVLLSPHVEWCLQMLSGIIEYLEHCDEEGSLLAGTGVNRTTTPSVKQRNDGMLKKNHLTSSFHRAKASKSNRESIVRGNRTTICEKMVQSLASIPHLIKTLLLIDDEAKREHIFRLTVVRRVVLDKQSIGKWLTSMLWSDSKRIAQRALNYLDLLSEVSEDEKTEVSCTDSLSRDVAKKKQEDLYEAVAQLDNLIPSMIDLDESMQEQAATSKIVRRVMDKMISRPFAVTVVFFDMLFLAVLIVSFRFSVHGYLNAYDPSYIIKCVYVANTSIFYYIIRELGQVISLTMIAKQKFGLKHFWSFWNIVDVMSVIMTLSSIVAMRRCLALGNCPLDEGSRGLRCCFALSTGLLWLRVLGLLKTINKQLATFVLAIVQVSQNIN